ncbi:NADPH dehydrogenase afvA [Paramyrothecium foliicola]|nr:NADPH dehydrogenase afvA [Paramyrothecium foliicola]
MSQDHLPEHHHPVIVNKGAKDVPFYTPEQSPPAGTARDAQPEGSLFSPLKLRGLTLQNRIFVSPMCQYSAHNGYMTPWHRQHHGSFATRGPGLVMTEVVSVSPEGRISPQDAGIWEDGQIAPMKDIVDYAHSQNAKIGIQIGHAGRKASTVAPWLDRKAAAVEEAGGWPENVLAPSAVAYSEDTFVPKAMSVGDINKFKDDWAAAVKRALAAGFDAIDIHSGHGYLLNQFLSPASNKRTDEYGGPFENRVRLLVEIVELTRTLVPEDFPLLVRLAGTDYLEHDSSLEQWTVDQAAELGKILASKGVDLLDVTGGGLDHGQKIPYGPGYQVHLTAAVKKAVQGTGAIVTAVGNITTGVEAQGYLQDGLIDGVFVGRPFLRNPNLVAFWAEELGVDIYAPAQYGWPSGNTRTHRSQHW